MDSIKLDNRNVLGTVSASDIDALQAKAAEAIEKLETEWKQSNDVLKRQILYGRGKKEVSGFCFYRYDSFQASTSKKELANLLPLLQK